ncbi:MAG: response regulator [Candidatus Omnitrophica bacterium]|nr:response regulator [Candidatus Omnitrophota bacterium]MCA9427269.1 response regulator [Candidatus Omnitrophota bacterium]MCA9447679.1 response regulator [Candidatus Omnitrophota bacterium]MCB9766591.1 response regulator [Candidatus Omnitrophota bacterium]
MRPKKHPAETRHLLADGNRKALILSSETVKQGTILIVDDSEQTRTILSGYLEGHNFEVLTAVNGREGFERALSEQPDLIVMDLMMPEQDGHEALDALSANPKTQEIPVIIISGKGSRLDEVLSYDKGAYFYLEKPFDLKQIVDRAQEFIES